MCGIAGVVEWGANPDERENAVRRMTGTLQKRGPDDSRFWSAQHASFGHTRLIVVDPAGGIQPMARGSYTIVYNGELYNTAELRAQLLKKGHVFQSHSDTEVLLTAFIEWGPACLERLNGIFAFAVWNESSQSLFLARDRLGVKPLFYMKIGAALLFSSEIKALLAHPRAKAELDRDGLLELLTLGPGRTPGNGVLKGVEELKPAHCMHVTEQGARISRYWNVESHPHRETAAETAVHLHDLLRDAVAGQLVADVPVCTFLSGGVDSSAISALAAAEINQPLRTFSVEYEDNHRFFQQSAFQSSEDGPWIQKVQAHIGSVHERVVVSQQAIAGRLADAMKARDLPGQADVDSSLLLFCERVKKTHTVALSGECADELFGGYPWFRQSGPIQSFPWVTALSEKHQLLHEKWNGLPLESQAKQRWRELTDEAPLLDGESEAEANRRKLFYANMMSFMAALLERKDRISMAAGLEVRVPFADHRLVEYAWNIPWEMKNEGGVEKSILRRALKDVLPEAVLYRKKTPYPKTHHPIYAEKVSALLRQAIQPGSPLLEIFSRNALLELAQSRGASYRHPWYGQLMQGPQLLAYLVQMNAWLAEYNIDVTGN